MRSPGSRPTNPCRRRTRKRALAQLEAALKNAKPIQFKENIALVLGIETAFNLSLKQNFLCCR